MRQKLKQKKKRKIIKGNKNEKIRLFGGIPSIGSVTYPENLLVYDFFVREILSNFVLN